MASYVNQQITTQQTVTRRLVGGVLLSAGLVAGAGALISLGESDLKASTLSLEAIEAPRELPAAVESARPMGGPTVTNAVYSVSEDEMQRPLIQLLSQSPQSAETSVWLTGQIIPVVD